MRRENGECTLSRGGMEPGLEEVTFETEGGAGRGEEKLEVST